MVNELRLLIGAPAIGSTFGGRDIAGLVFIGVAIAAIWIAFRHILARAAKEDSPPVDPPPPK